MLLELFKVSSMSCYFYFSRISGVHIVNIYLIALTCLIQVGCFLCLYIGWLFCPLLVDVIFPGGSFSFVVLSGDFQNYFNILLFRGLEARLYMHPFVWFLGYHTTLLLANCFAQLCNKLEYDESVLLISITVSKMHIPKFVQLWDSSRLSTTLCKMMVEKYHWKHGWVKWFWFPTNYTFKSFTLAWKFL